ncbi:hypothetical protein EVAR_98127_1 [Eumeta japonica]|uniref:Uncharacterized protein n=1 Tax=Eumeta variegata TaxID=151549 RepID=A0A4C2A5N4_EUMVA|nr:hypothetical protein EVAR_98127_1 [Eumeta japonica]
MERFSGGDSNAVHDIVTCEESWTYCYDPETKALAKEPWPMAELKVKAGREAEAESIDRVEVDCVTWIRIISMTEI